MSIFDVILVYTKNMELTIYRGTNEIGGNCVELANNNTRILFDFGLPLNAMDIENIKLEDYKPNIHSNYNAVFLSHAHPDHYGLLSLLDKSTPIYASTETCKIIKSIAPLINKFNIKEHNLIAIDNPIKIDDFVITPNDTDHSICGACAYTINCEEKTIVYTGDIRFHGRCWYKNAKFKKSLGKIDYLIMEGTTINRKKNKKITENSLIPKFTKIFKTKKLNLVEFSPQNLDRFISIYKACLKAKKTLVIDPYTAYLLELYGEDNKNIPQYHWNNIRIYFANNSISSALAKSKKLYEYKTKKISIEEIKENKTDYVIKGNYIINDKILKEVDKKNLNIVYSKWSGYLNKKNQFENFKDIITHIHTSGHANVEDLQKFVDDVKPSSIIPIHTEHKDKYKEFFNATVVDVNDNEIVEL